MRLQLGGFWYLASPYSGTPDEMEFRAFEARWYMGELLKKGIICYSPIWSMHHISLSNGIPPDAKTWWAFNKVFMAASIGTIVACIPGWKQSFGIQEEIEYTRTFGRPIQYAVKRDNIIETMDNVSKDYAS